MGARYWLVGLLAAACFAISCGGDSSGGGNGDGGTDNGDGGGSGVDAPPFSGECTPNGPYECSDCADNDMDGKIDGFDPQCSGPLDDREDSFATGIPGDNMDATEQDCFFDGNSGHGMDCNQHVCCLLQAKAPPQSDPDKQLMEDRLECQRLAPNSLWGKYDPAKCYKPFGNADIPASCTKNCGPLTPPGCDCFGCCTVCNDSGCRDIVLNPMVSPDCKQENVTDPGPDGMDNTGDEPCRRCVKSTCGNEECGGSTCILCPGQDPSTLPSECMDQACPEGVMKCEADGSCPEGLYCASGCCVGIIL